MAADLSRFLRPGRFCDYEPDGPCARRARELAGSADLDVTVLTRIYAWVASHVAYDHEKADRLRGGHGYVPDPDQTYRDRTGVCFDSASLMVAMLRAVGIPAKLVVGYMDGGLTHAWVVARAGGRWCRCDPTVAADGRDSSKNHTYRGVQEL